MAICLYEEKGGFRVYDEEAKRSSRPAENIEELLGALEKGRDIRLYAGLKAFSMRKTVLPDFDRNKMQEVLPFEMEGLFLSPSSALIFDFYPLRAVEKGTECLVFALKRETAEHYAAPFVKAGLNLVSLSPLWDDRLSEFFPDEGAFYRAALNLAPAYLTGEKNKRKTMDVYRTVSLYAIAVLLVFLTGLSVRYFLTQKKEARISKEISAAYASLFPEQKMPPDLYYGIQSKLAELKQNYRVLKGTEVLGILKLISESSPDGIRLKELNMDGSRATLKGEGSEYAAVDQFRNNLGKGLKNVQLLETKSMQDGRAVFVMEASLYE